MQKRTVKPFYTSSEIAKVIGYTPKGARLFLMSYNIPIHLVGNKYIIYITDLEIYAPDLFASILLSENLNYIHDSNQPEENHNYVQSQFYAQNK